MFSNEDGTTLYKTLENEGEVEMTIKIPEPNIR